MKKVSYSSFLTLLEAEKYLSSHPNSTLIAWSLPNWKGPFKVKYCTYE